VLVEGYKREAHPMIEVRRTGAKSLQPLAPDSGAIVAIAADHVTDGGDLPVFHIDDIAGIADFIERYCGLA